MLDKFDLTDSAYVVSEKLLSFAVFSLWSTRCHIYLFDYPSNPQTSRYKIRNETLIDTGTNLDTKAILNSLIPNTEKRLHE